MAFCEHCGTRLTEGERFCSGCGARRIDTAADPASATGDAEATARAPRPGADADHGPASPPADAAPALPPAPGAGSVASRPPPVPAEGAPQGAGPTRARSRRRPVVIAVVLLLLALVGGSATAWLVVGEEPSREPAVEDPTDPDEGADPAPPPVVSDHDGDEDLESDTSMADQGDADEDVAPVDFEEVAEEASAAVLRLVALSCGAQHTIGTAVVTEQGVLTEARLVEDAMALALELEDGTIAETRVHHLDERGIAVLARPSMASHDLTVAGQRDEDDPPLALLLVDDDGVDPNPIEADSPDLAALPLPTGRGDHGAPLVDREGRLLGIVTNVGEPTGAVDRLDVDAALSSAEGTDPIEPARCEDPAPLDRSVDVVIDAGLERDEAEAVVEMYRDYFGGINRRDLDLAYARYSASWRSANAFDGFAGGTQTTGYPTDPQLLGLEERGDDLVSLVEFVSLQHPGEQHAPEPGETCSVWRLEHRLVNEDGGWRIDGIPEAAEEGAVHRPCPD